jgi:D-galactarolactone isomerase
MIPRLNVPPGSCDAHVHIFEAATVATAGKVLEVAPLADYLGQRESLCIARTVFVQPSAFGFDNGGVLAATQTVGPQGRAVVTIPPTITEDEVAALTRKGARGARFHLLKSAAQSWDDLLPVAERVAAHGWHVQLQCDGRALGERADFLRRLPCPLVIDQTGKFLEPVEVDHPGFRALLALVEAGHTYVKLSAPYEVSRTGAPAYADVGVLARALVEAAPDRMFWGSNWPHHALPVERRPADADMLDLLLEWAPDPLVQRQILVDNPARIYGFA